jgi:hypothetical protein
MTPNFVDTTLKTLEQLEINFIIYIKDKDHKWKNTTEVAEIGWIYSIKNAHININPITYIHLINIIDCF